MKFFRQLGRFISWEYRRTLALHRSSPIAKRELARAARAYVPRPVPCPYCGRHLADLGWRLRWHMSGCGLPTEIK